MQCTIALVCNNIRNIEMTARAFAMFGRHNCAHKRLSLFLKIGGFFNRDSIVSVIRDSTFRRYLILIVNNCRPNRLSGNSAWISNSSVVRVFGLLQVRLHRQRRQTCRCRWPMPHIDCDMKGESCIDLFRHWLRTAQVRWMRPQPDRSNFVLRQNRLHQLRERHNDRIWRALLRLLRPRCRRIQE